MTGNKNSRDQRLPWKKQFLYTRARGGVSGASGKLYLLRVGTRGYAKDIVVISGLVSQVFRYLIRHSGTSLDIARGAAKSLNITEAMVRKSLRALSELKLISFCTQSDYEARFLKMATVFKESTRSPARKKSSKNRRGSF